MGAASPGFFELLSKTCVALSPQAASTADASEVSTHSTFTVEGSSPYLEKGSASFFAALSCTIVTVRSLSAKFLARWKPISP